MVSFTDNYNAISIDRLSSKTNIGKASWYCSLLCKPEFSSAPKTFLLLLKKRKTTTLQEETGENATNLVLKRMLRHFLKILSLKKVLQFLDRIYFF